MSRPWLLHIILVLVGLQRLKMPAGVTKSYICDWCQQALQIDA